MSNARISGHFVLAVLCAPLLMGGACEKKTAKPVDTGAMKALDNAGAPGGAADGPVDTSPLAGVDLSKLEGDRVQLFYKMVGSLKSPCRKAHSLRTSFTSDKECRRAPFAVRYVLAMLQDEASENEARAAYVKKYEHAGPPIKIDVSKAPHLGSDNAQVKLVEFFDYSCPHCQQFKPSLDQVLADKAGQVSLHLMMFPLEQTYPRSRSAGQAAIAANLQGRFKEMHAKLFEVAPRHGRDDVMSYAKELGLDLARFEKDYESASAQVTTDLAQGEAAGVSSTPTLFFNDRRYDGPLHPKYIGLWIDEEVAVNR